MGLTGQVCTLESKTYTWTLKGKGNTNIKGKNPQKWRGGLFSLDPCEREKREDIGTLGRRLRTQVLQPVLMEGLARQAEPARIRATIKATIKPPICVQGHAFQAHSLQIILLGPFAYEPNVIHGSLQIVSLQLVPSVGKACALAQVAVGLSLCQAKVREGASISSDMLLLFQHKFPLGAMPDRAKGMDNSRDFQHQVNPPPTLVKGLTFGK